MAGTDHGEVLTRFEEIFGTLVEHEVIKLILQSCEWDPACASDILLGMVDKDNLPPHVLAALTADSIVRGLRRGHPTCSEPPPYHEIDPLQSDPLNMTQDEDNEVPDTTPATNNGADTSIQSTISDSTSATPVITVPPSDSAFHDGRSPSTLHQPGMDGRQGACSPPHASIAKGGESETSSPSFSPLRPNKSVTSADSLDVNASGWVLAPEFVPNAFNRKASDVDVRHGMLPQGISTRLMAASNSLSSNQRVKDGLTKKEEIIDKILRQTKLMVLMRGLPGSGKSTLAQEVKGPYGVVLSTDDFFCDKHGKYVYDASKIGEAHQWNKHRAIQRLQQGKTPIIIDNTNLQVWEMMPYIQLALQYGYDVDLLDAEDSWRLSPKVLARRNTHGVPAKKIEEMKARYEQDLRIEDLIAKLQCSEGIRSSPRRSVSAKINKAAKLENDVKSTKVTRKRSPLKMKKEQVIDKDAEPDEALRNIDEFYPPVKGDEIFDSDDDVVVEGYDDEILPTPISTSSDEIPVPQVNQNISASGSEIKEATTDNQEKLGGCALLGKASKLSTFDESADSLIDLTLALQTTSLSDNERKDPEIPDDSDNLRDKLDSIPTNEAQNENEISDEAKIQRLLDEACKSIDFTKSEEEWDSLTSQIAGEDISDEKFNDLVSSFGSALKKQIENRGSVGFTETQDIGATSDVNSEDSAMYDLCSTMEDKTGQPLSALITKLTRNEDSSAIPPTHSAGEPNMADAECDVTSHTNESHTESLPINLATTKGEINTQNNAEQKHATTDSTQNQSKKESDDKNKDSSSEIHTGANSPLLGGFGKPPSQDTTYMQPDNGSLISWECVDINSGMSSVNWDAKSDSPESGKNDRTPKPSRTRQNRISGSPSKWLKETDTKNENNDDTAASWVAVEGAIPDWDPQEPAQTCTPESSSSQHYVDEEPQSHTGAISKSRKYKRHSTSSSANSGCCRKAVVTPVNDCRALMVYEGNKNAETQTLSIDFEALDLDHNLYELKVIYGKPHYIPVVTIGSNFNEKGPLTKGGLRLEKGTMTHNSYEDNSVGSSFQNLVAFFPNIPKEDLRDVFEKCNHNSDWAMNVLLDSGYEMSDPSDITAKDITDADIETDSVSDTTNTDNGKNDCSSSDTYDIPSESISDERTRKIKQSQQPEDLARKIEIEKSFGFSESVDDRVLRLTGKQYNDLNMTKVKKNKTRKQQGKRNSSPSNNEARETVEEEGEGAQYITLLMDPLFASQLNMLFGPVGDCEISGDLTTEDRSVVLPLEICEMIHKYWARTVNGRFKHEAEILDSLVHQDEILARKLQEEENAAFNLGTRNDDVANDGLPEDQPVRFQEIMHLEQALQESLAKKTPEDTSISYQLSLQLLYQEYPHVDPVAVKEEYTRSGCKYPITVQRLNQRYGKEQGTPKTVIAPEAISRYEQEMIERAQQSSLAGDQDMSSSQHSEMVPDDPQVYRDEAQTHYHQRQEAFQKAQEAYRQGMKNAAAYYAHIGNLHSEKLREANKRASEKILEAQNAHRKDASCLDLHLLHVPEAISATQAFLSERQRVLIARGIKQMEVSLITGRGAHSAGGQAVLKPAIKEHLQKHGYSFCEANSGMLKVILRSKPS